MATSDQVLRKADDLIDALQALIDDPAYSVYRQFLEGMQLELIGARDRFANAGPPGTSDPRFDTIARKLDAALAKARAARPTDASMRGLGRAVAEAIGALGGAAARGLLRLIG
jgi:hypothetical protein